MTSRRLVLLRHAEAASAPGLSDLERPLTDRGVEDADRVGARLAEHLGGGVDLAVVSPALRTRQTWDAVARSVPATEAVSERAVYEASVEDLLQVVRELPGSAATVLLVGHAPGVPALAEALGGPAEPGTVSGELLARMRAEGWHPGTWGVVDLQGDWAEAGPGTGGLRHLEHTA